MYWILKVELQRIIILEPGPQGTRRGVADSPTYFGLIKFRNSQNAIKQIHRK